jgi:hypothetical protein
MVTMDSTPAVGLAYRHSTKLWAERFPDPSLTGDKRGPAPQFEKRGPGGIRTCKAMYSAPAVECVFVYVSVVKGDRRGVDQRLNAALPLSYASELPLVEAAGFEPATRGS